MDVKILVRTAVALAVLAAVAACTAGAQPRSGPSSSHSSAAPARAYDATLAADSARLTESYVATSRTESTTTTMSGSYSWAAQQGQLQYDERLAGSVSGTSVDLRLHGTELVDRRRTYTRSTVSGPGIRTPVDSRWSEATWTGTDAGSALSVLFAVVGIGFGEGQSPLPPGGPAGLLQMLHADSVLLNDEGGQLIGTVPTTHYRATVPLSKLTYGSDLLAVRAALGTDAFEVDYWLDSAQRLHRMRTGFVLRHAPPPDGGVQVQQALPLTVSVVLDLADYGVSCTSPRRPPAESVRTAPAAAPPRTPTASRR